MWVRADAIDRNEGAKAYSEYNQVMQAFAQYYAFDFKPVVAAFVAMSPNSDYIGNLRSLASLLNGINEQIPLEQINVATYRHNLKRAYGYMHGEPFEPRGAKISAFYQNIVNPFDPVPVTIDGHMVGCYLDNDFTMKELIIRRKQYNEIADDFRLLAKALGILPNQLQATLWFTRKRVLNIRYRADDLFAPPDDIWSVRQTPQTCKPYALRAKTNE